MNAGVKRGSPSLHADVAIYVVGDGPLAGIRVVDLWEEGFRNEAGMPPAKD